MKTWLSFYRDSSSKTSLHPKSEVTGESKANTKSGTEMGEEVISVNSREIRSFESSSTESETKAGNEIMEKRSGIAEGFKSDSDGDGAESKDDDQNRMMKRMSMMKEREKSK
ncbi:hypothetical protein U1Q18_040766 [Sarracenia purpurea var. burkii]